MESCVYEMVNKVCGIKVLGTKNNLIKICAILYLQMHCELPHVLKMVIHFFSSNNISTRVAAFPSVVSPNFALFYLGLEVVPNGAGKKVR